MILSKCDWFYWNKNVSGIGYCFDYEYIVVEIVWNKYKYIFLNVYLLRRRDAVK